MLNSRLLVLTPRFPYPHVGGDRLRIYQLCKLLSAHFRLTLLSMCESEAEMDRVIPDDHVFSEVHRVLHNRLSRFAGCLRALPSRRPIQVGYYQNFNFAQRVTQLAPLHDGVFAHLVRTGPYLTNCTQAKILEMTDAISLSYIRASRYVDPLRSILYRIESNRLIGYERELAEKVDVAVLVSAVDRNFLFGQGGGERVVVCPNGVDGQAFPFQFFPDGRTIVFIGNNLSYPNRDAILYFSSVIMPLIRGRLPHAQFKVIGRIRESLRRKLEARGVIVAGSVDSVSDAARTATVGVCPLRIGAGIQNKLLEYMALGIPAVTSPVGLEGLDATPGVHLMTATSPDEWAQRVAELLLNRSLARRMAEAGRHLIETRYQWASFEDNLVQSVKDAVDGGRIKRDVI